MWDVGYVMRAAGYVLPLWDVQPEFSISDFWFRTPRSKFRICLLTLLLLGFCLEIIQFLTQQPQMVSHLLCFLVA